MIVRYRGVGSRCEYRPNEIALEECAWKICLDEADDGGALSGSCRVIQGVLQFENVVSYYEPDKPFEFTDLRIELQGKVWTNFAAKVNGYIQYNYEKSHDFIPDPNELDSENDDQSTSSTIYHFIRKGKPAHPNFVARGEGPHSFPFSINWNGLTSFPPTFESPYGWVKYYLVVYVGYVGYTENYQRNFQAFEQELIVRDGRLNLGLWVDPRQSNGNANGDSILVQKKKDSSFFNRKKRTLATTLRVVEKQGFLLGETITCHLDVDNPLGEIIQKITISLSQKIIFFTNLTSKSTLTLLDQKEFEGFDTLAQFRCETVIQIPKKNVMPTFTRKHKTVEVRYLLQFNIEYGGKYPLRGETLIVIGTTRDSSGGTNQLVDKQNSNVNTHSNLNQRLSRLREWETKSIDSDTSLPPSYSKLGSRKASQETLPPAYDQVPQ